MVYASLGALRLEIAKNYDLIDNNKFNFLWVTDFPLLEFDEEENRFVVHLLYAVPTPRGKGIYIIEDILPVYDTEVTVKTDKKIKKVYIAPEQKEIPFVQEGDKVTFKVDKFECHTMPVLCY